MSRVAIVLSLLFIFACAKKSADSPPLPDSIAGGWHRTALEMQPLDRAPDAARKAGLRNWWRAEYAGPGRVHLEIFELASGAAGLDLVQKWRPSASAVTFYTERYFTVVRWEDADRDALRQLIGRLQKLLGG